jgi:Fe-S-cluster-containing dehydrogenase component
MIAKTEGEWKVVFDTRECTGCHTCEMACSYYHSSSFHPSVSSIEIIRKPEQSGFRISFYKDSHKGHLACNGCPGLEEPFCVKYCPAIARDELKATVSQFKKLRNV